MTPDNLTGCYLTRANGNRVSLAMLIDGTGVDQVHIKDIARSLSRIYRYAGQGMFDYSVAQHSIMCADFATRLWRDYPSHRDIVRQYPKELWSMWALMHDAHEAYIGDLPQPLDNVLHDLGSLKYTIQCTIHDAFGIPDPCDDALELIGRCDYRALCIEASTLLPPLLNHIPEHQHSKRDENVTIEIQSPDVSELQFLGRFHYLMYGPTGTVT